MRNIEKDKNQNLVEIHSRRHKDKIQSLALKKPTLVVERHTHQAFHCSIKFSLVEQKQWLPLWRHYSVFLEEMTLGVRQ